MKIKINEPCDADWNKMKIGLKSRHCELCVKNVMDFTQMSREEILMYLFNNKRESTCARMYGGQMDFRFQELEGIVEGTRRQKGNKAFLVLSFATLALMSCKDGNEPQSPQPNSSNPIEIVTDTTLIDTDSISVLKKNTKPKITKGKTIKDDEPVLEHPIDQILDGEIMIIDEPLEMGGMVEMPLGGAVRMEMPYNTIVDVSNLDLELKVNVLENNQEDTSYNIVEKMPEFIGGTDSLMSYISRGINYPKKAQKAGVEGRVYIELIVEKDGRITNAKVLKGIGKGCNEEALRIVNSMPNWIPGENKGEKVRVKYNLPIKFVLK